jgi:DNA-binding NarL/FixJ family response regulator
MAGLTAQGLDSLRRSVNAIAEQLQPDVILMDIHMPGTNGIEATRRIVHTSPHIRILIVTMSEDDASMFAAMRAGARGYALKDAQRRTCCGPSARSAAGKPSSVRPSQPA